MGRRRFHFPLLLALSILFVVPPHSSAAQTSFTWSQFGYDEQHSGVDPLETTINAANARLLKRLYRIPLVSSTAHSVADGAPVFLSSVNVSGARDLLFVTTKDGWILALDASSGRQIWGRQNGPNGCLIGAGFFAGQPCYTTSAPAIDPNRQFVYSYGLDGYVHKHAVATGTETRDDHWPELVNRKPMFEKGTSDLSTGTDKHGSPYLYVASSGNLGDEGDYQGHLTTINLQTGAQHVFNATCSDMVDVHFVLAPTSPSCPDTQSAIWARPSVVHDSASDLIFFATGNGNFNPAHHRWADSVLALNPDGTGISGNPVDSYTPANQDELQAMDEDLGSSGPGILPPISNSVYQHLAVQGQKIDRANGTANLRLINLDNLSGNATRGPGHTGGEIGSTVSVPQVGFLDAQPTVWVNPADPGRPWVFVAGNSGLSALQVYVDSGKSIPTLHVRWGAVRGGSTTPIIANGVLYFFSATGVQALRPTDGTHLWSDASFKGLHWESPIVVTGMLYITDESGNLSAYRIQTGGIPSVKFIAKRQGANVTFRWSVSSAKGVTSFLLYSGIQAITPVPISSHSGRAYRHIAHWPITKNPGKFSLRIVMANGIQFSVRAQ